MKHTKRTAPSALQFMDHAPIFDLHRRGQEPGSEYAKLVRAMLYWKLSDLNIAHQELCYGKGEPCIGSPMSTVGDICEMLDFAEAYPHNDARSIAQRIDRSLLKHQSTCSDGLFSIFPEARDGGVLIFRGGIQLWHRHLRGLSGWPGYDWTEAAVATVDQRAIDNFRPRSMSEPVRT